MFTHWNCTLIGVSASFHGIAILCTLFRLWYRWHTGRLWWDDAWTVPALLGDIACLIVTLLEQPVPDDTIPRFFEAGNWIFSLAYPIVMWTTRVSILVAIIRVSRPEGILRRAALGIGAFFGLMGVAMFATRLSLCIPLIFMTRQVLILQVSSDCVADVLLSALPIWFLHDMRLSRKRKILISSAFSATLVVTIVTVVEAIMLFQTVLTSGSIIFEHLKVACSLIVCNLLVIVTFVYRVLHKGKANIDDSIPGEIEFTTVDLAQVELGQEASVGWLSSSTKSKSSSWSFHGNQSKTSGSTAVAFRIERMDECE